MYTETELETIGIITEQAKQKAWSLGFEGANDLEDAFNVIMWRLEYLETAREIRQAERQLQEIESETPEGSAHLSQLRDDGQATTDHLEYLSRRLTAIREAEPVHMKSII